MSTLAWVLFLTKVLRGCRVAGERYSSVYLPEETFPMLPHALSRGAASLLRGRPNAALTISAVLDEHGPRLTGCWTDQSEA